ncbi:MAG: YmaF family protein [Clostridiales bacterium]|jgi:hypothetical protein|nr:YmaF family protein [Clostridiales bacterium]
MLHDWIEFWSSHPIYYEDESELCIDEISHDHEFSGSVIFFIGYDLHSHYLSGLSGPAIFTGGSHYHKIITNTDIHNTHFHSVCLNSGPAIFIGRGMHVHFIEGNTDIACNHKHRIILATLPES